jgi:hypothetical protein
MRDRGERCAAHRCSLINSSAFVFDEIRQRFRFGHNLENGAACHYSTDTLDWDNSAQPF